MKKLLLIGVFSASMSGVFGMNVQGNSNDEFGRRMTEILTRINDEQHKQGITALIEINRGYSNDEFERRMTEILTIINERHKGEITALIEINRGTGQMLLNKIAERDARIAEQKAEIQRMQEQIESLQQELKEKKKEDLPTPPCYPKPDPQEEIEARLFEREWIISKIERLQRERDDWMRYLQGYRTCEEGESKKSEVTPTSREEYRTKRLQAPLEVKRIESQLNELRSVLESLSL